MTQQLAGIAVRSGGSVGVYTELGHGSSFKVYLPRAEGEGTVAEAAPPALRRVGAQTVLVVEDADGLRLLAKRLLERQGYKVLVAADAKETPGLARCPPTWHCLLEQTVHC